MLLRSALCRLCRRRASELSCLLDRPPAYPVEGPENSMKIPSRLPDHEEEEEYDDALFYEDIQAPKFVDLTAPDAGRPDDDPAWFCLRVGCEQGHEQVDPEALDRSFFMRVMAARSPNLRGYRRLSTGRTRARC